MADSAFDKFVAKLPADYFRSESEKDSARVAFAAGVTVGAFGVVADTARERDSRAGGEAASGSDLSASARPTFAKLTAEQEAAAMERFHADFGAFWQEVKDGEFWTLKETDIGAAFNAYAAGYFDGGKAARELPAELLRLTKNPPMHKAGSNG